MGFMDELRRLARPYEDEEVEEFDDFEPVYRSERSERAERTERAERRPVKAAAAVGDTGPMFASDSERSERSERRSNKVVNIHTTTQLQVVLVKPERFENASEIADHLREKRTVVLNLESTNKDIARRLLDFLSGVAYANEGKIKKVAISTYIITPYNVDILGDLIDELENNGLYL
ncbi:MAG: cell division protein SepF [Flavonifractor sp.]|nr:cell division protein SepF [Flavonifractor sp.]MCI9426084.1 cell division protein SepF [Flavonifractor sp.]MCI9474208.1 cell division protein SepF [Flavonifractor sp.]